MAAIGTPTVTAVAAAGQTAQAVFNNVRDRLAGQTAGFQNLGTIQNSTGGQGYVMYDPVANIFYVVAI